jgi:Big-like domain-containing protein
MMSDAGHDSITRVLAVAMLCLVALAVWGAGCANAATLGQAVAIQAPTGARTAPNAILNGIACPAANQCVAVGSYVDSAGIKQAMVVTQDTNGDWRQAVEVTAPAEPASGPYGASLASVACTSADACIAVGSYTDSSGNLLPMETTEANNGSWNNATEVLPPAEPSSGAQEASLTSVGCPGAGSGSCVAVGYYFNAGGYWQSMTASGSTSGLGGSAAVTPPGDAAAEGSSYWPAGTSVYAPLLTAVGCSDPGTCLAIGNYYNSSGTELPMLTSGGGTAASAITSISEPSGDTAGSGSFNAIACPGTGYCEAGGRGGNDDAAMVVSQAPNGVWSQETLIEPPGDADPASVHSLACPDFYSCIAIGSYNGGAFVSTEQDGGTWSSATAVPAPSGGSGADLWGVSCPPKDTADCWGAGSYSDSNSYGQAMVVQDSYADNATPTPPAPVCKNVSVTTPSATPATVTLNCTDSAGAALTYAITGNPSHGTLGAINQSNGQVTYTPTAGYSGTDSVTYHASSSNGVAAPATVSITILPPAPVCKNAAVTTRSGVPAAVTLNCTDSAGAALTYAITGNPGHGKLGAVTQSNAQVTYTPTAGYSGSDSFTYDASSSNGVAASATVSITVLGPGTPHIGTVKIASPKITATVTCVGIAAQTCTGSLTLTIVEHLTGSKVTAVTAAKKLKHTTRTLTLGSAGYNLTGGAAATLTITLSATATSLLKKLHKLPARLTLTATGASIAAATATITIHPAAAKPKHHRT